MHVDIFRLAIDSENYEAALPLIQPFVEADLTPKRPVSNGCGEGERCPVRGPVTTCSGRNKNSTCEEVRRGCLVYRLDLGGGFKYFLFSPLLGGRFPI